MEERQGLEEKRLRGKGETAQGTGNMGAAFAQETNNKQQATNNNLDIGPVRADEADSMLRVMCAAFELPFEVARPIFYADPYFDLNAKRVLRVDGHIVSCLTLSETLCRVGEGYAPIVGIAGLATLPAFQNQGYAARLLHSTVETLRERNAPLVGLYPFESEYYTRLGWETATLESRWTAAPSALPAYPEASNVIRAELEDMQAAARLYAEHPGTHCLSAARDLKRWQYLFDRMGEKFVYRQQNVVTGYLFCETQPGTLHVDTGEPDVPPTVRVLEMCASTASARRGLLGHLAARTAWGRIEYVSSWERLRDMGLLDLPCPPGQPTGIVHVETLPALMLRVVDFPALLECLRPNWRDFKDTVALTLHDGQRPGFAATVVLKREQDALVLRVKQAAAGVESTLDIGTDVNPGAEVDHAVIDHAIDHIEGDVRVWAKVAVGHISGADACSLGLLRASTPRAAQLAGVLFPSRSPSLPALDHF